jgi:hypothetical protein
MRILILLSMLALLPAMGRAQASRPPFPEFTVLDPSGNAVPSTTLVAARATVLAVVRPSCGRCDQLLNALGRLQEDAGAAGGALVILVESPPDEAAAFAARKIPPALSGVPWFADAGREARSALDLKGAPVLFGVERSRIAWSYAGAPERGLLESLLRTWNRAGASR